MEFSNRKRNHPPEGALSDLQGSILSLFEIRPRALTLPWLACIIVPPQVGWAIAVLRCRDRGKSALHRARRRIAPGAGNPPRGANLPDKGHRNKQPAHSARGEGDGEKVV